MFLVLRKMVMQICLRLPATLQISLWMLFGFNQINLQWPCWVYLQHEGLDIQGRKSVVVWWWSTTTMMVQIHVNMKVVDLDLPCLCSSCLVFQFLAKTSKLTQQHAQIFFCLDSFISWMVHFDLNVLWTKIHLLVFLVGGQFIGYPPLQHHIRSHSCIWRFFGSVIIPHLLHNG